MFTLIDQLHQKMARKVIYFLVIYTVEQKHLLRIIHPNNFFLIIPTTAGKRDMRLGSLSWEDEMRTRDA